MVVLFTRFHAVQPYRLRTRGVRLLSYHFRREDASCRKERWRGLHFNLKFYFKLIIQSITIIVNIQNAANITEPAYIEELKRKQSLRKQKGVKRANASENEAGPAGKGRKEVNKKSGNRKRKCSKVWVLSRLLMIKN